MAGNFVRMKAARLFAAEIKATTVPVPKVGDDQYESQLYLTPTGAKIARVMIVGAATEIEDIGSDTSFYRMRVADPTGVHFVTAGQYQPEAAKAIQGVMGKVPVFVAVVGKVSVYSGSENTPLVSIRAEQVTVVDEVVRDTWLLEASKATLDRLSALKANQVLEQEVAAAYPTKEDYKEIVKAVLKSMKESADISTPSVPTPPVSTPSTPAAPAPAAPAKAPAPPAQSPSKTEPAKVPDTPQEGMTSEQMDDFVEQQIITRNKGKGVKIETLGNPCKGAGIKLLQLEETVKRLMDQGKIYEPKLGLLMPTGA
jgi:RPA family protein